jgi:hypothetical protein
VGEVQRHRLLVPVDAQKVAALAIDRRLVPLTGFVSWPWITLFIYFIPWNEISSFKI